MSVRVFAPAKINLTLQVGRPRADGRHPLQSIVAFADVGDWIEARPADALTLAIDGDFAYALAPDDDNLVLRAARALGPARGAAITLTKNLPIASGIGGGSSDAAATLKALNALWGMGLSEGDLMRVAAALGADVPVCVAAQSAYMTGAGEIVTPFVAPELPVVLVNPLTPLSTAAVYREFDRMDLGGAFAPAPAPVWPDAASARSAIAASVNDLAAPARSLANVIGEIEALLRADDRVGHAALSGSGATVFALCETFSAAEAVAADVRWARPDWWARAACVGRLDAASADR